MHQHLFFKVRRSQYWLAWVAIFVANILVSIIGTSVLEGTAGASGGGAGD